MLASSYNNVLIVCSILVAILASYTALNMAGRIASASVDSTRWWLAGGACAMGIGVWSMHFIGMLALNLPIPLGYDPLITLLSLLIAIVSSAFALWLVCQQTLPWLRLINGAVLMGAGIASMHYTGMAAMQMTPGIEYIPSWVVLSVAIAILVSGAALWIVFNLLRHPSWVRYMRCAASIIMGLGIVGMHYTGMAAAQFPLGSVCGAAQLGITSEWLAIVIIASTLGILAVALSISMLERRLEKRTALLASSLNEANQEVSYLSLHDPLTKLPNRMLLEDRIERMLEKAERKHTRFALILIDLDAFKGINSSYGHHIGDQLLVAVALRLKPGIRPQDTFARTGGDEFVLLAKVAEPADAAGFADQILASIQEPFQIAGYTLRVSATIGIAMYPDNGLHQNDLRTNANAAMSHAKTLGHNKYCFFEASMHSNVHQQQRLMQDLRTALDQQELMLHYQPKFSAPDGPISGVEALLRWQHPEQGQIPPDVFIPLAEKTGLIVPIGEWVLDQACKQIKQWHNEGRAGWTMAVNLSALQFSHANLIQTVHDALQRHALEPHYLTLEVTESTAMRDVEASLRILQQLSDMGVRISIDDFGTGYSSLLYLKRLPATELKIDRGFIRNLANDSEDAAIVSAIVALAKTLKMNIVAEGVETTAQQEFLTGLGCDLLQGYLLGHPMSAAQLNQEHVNKPSD